eukprot:GILJ01000996.1.p1 GENE.GILJ01000996.1~~GILJ01000996.1.p1  ORF type:complete len:1101 (+),score=172.47 GILJ01000996.1:115-3417(+)
MKAVEVVCVLLLCLVCVSARETQLLRESNKCARFKSCETCLGQNKEVLEFKWGLLPSLKKVTYDCLWLPYYLGSKDGECLSSRRYARNKLGSSSATDAAGPVLGQNVEDVCPTSHRCKQISDPLICLTSGCHLASAECVDGTEVAMCLTKAEATDKASHLKHFDETYMDIAVRAAWFAEIISAKINNEVKISKSMVDYLQLRLRSPIINNLADLETTVLATHETNFAKAASRERDVHSCDTPDLQGLFRDLMSIIDAIPSTASFRDPFFIRVMNMFPASRIAACKTAIDFDNMETTASEEDAAFRARTLQERQLDITRSRKDMLKRSLETWARYGIPEPVFWLPPVKQTELNLWAQNPLTTAQLPRAGALFDDIRLTKQVVNNVLTMITAFSVQHEVLTAIETRYKKYKTDLELGTKVDLPKYYHATEHADLVIKSKKLKSSDSGRFGAGIYLSTVPEMTDVKKKKAEYGDYGFALGASFEKYFVNGALVSVSAGYDQHLWVTAQPPDNLHPFIERNELVYAFAAKKSAIQQLRTWFEEQQIEALVITYEEAMIERELLNQARIESRDRANALLESRFSIAEAVQKLVYRSNIKVSREVCYEDAIPLLVKSIGKEHITASMQWYLLHSGKENKFKLKPTEVTYLFYKNPSQADQGGQWEDVHYSQYVEGKYFSQAETRGLWCTGLTVTGDDVLTSLANGAFGVVPPGVCNVDPTSPVADLLEAMKKYRTTNVVYHDGDLLHHSVWSAKAASRFLDLPASHPEAYFSQLIRKMEKETLDRVKLLTILASLLHDVGKGGWGERTKKLGTVPTTDTRVFDLIDLHPELSFCMLANSDVEGNPESAELGELLEVPQAMKWMDGGEARDIFADLIADTLALSQDEKKLVAVLAGMHYEFGNFMASLERVKPGWYSDKIGVEKTSVIYGSLPLDLIHERFGDDYPKVGESAEQYVMMFHYLARLVGLDLCNVEITTTSETSPSVKLSLEEMVEMAVVVGVADVRGSNLVDVPDAGGELELPAVCNEVPHAARDKLWNTYSYYPERAGQARSVLLEYVQTEKETTPSYCDNTSAKAPPALSNNVTPNPCAEEDTLFEFCGCVESLAK